jgi:hypothetical protein
MGLDVRVPVEVRLHVGSIPVPILVPVAGSKLRASVWVSNVCASSSRAVGATSACTLSVRALSICAAIVCRARNGIG